MIMYYVWERNDGEVGVSTYAPRDWDTPQGKPIKFTVLKVFPEWNSVVVDYIGNERKRVLNSTQPKGE